MSMRTRVRFVWCRMGALLHEMGHFRYLSSVLRARLTSNVRERYCSFLVAGQQRYQAVVDFYKWEG